MLDYAKIQGEIIKILVKMKLHGDYCRIVWGNLPDNNVGVAYGDLTAMFIIPKSLWVVNPVGVTECASMEKFADNSSEHDIAIIAEIREIPVGKKKKIVKRFQSQAGASEWFDDDILKQFGDDVEIRLPLSTHFGQVYHHGVRVGVVASMNPKTI